MCCKTLQRAEGSSDLRKSETQDRAEHRLEVASAGGVVDTGVPTPPLLTPQHPYETPRTTQPDNKSKYPLDVRRWARRPTPVVEASADATAEPVEDTRSRRLTRAYEVGDRDVVNTVTTTAKRSA